MGNVYVEALKKRGNISDDIIKRVEEQLKEPEPDPPPPPPPTEFEALRDYVLDLDCRLILLELGLFN